MSTVTLFIQGHFLSIIIEPCSSYSCLLIHICQNDPSELKIDPPTHGENFLSLLLITFTLTFCGEISGICLCNLSKNPLKRVLPPDKITFWNRSLLISISDLPIDSTIMCWIPVNPGNFSLGVKSLSVNVTLSPYKLS